MTDRLVKADLTGYLQDLSSESTVRNLNVAYERRDTNGADLERLGMSMQGFKSISRPITDDKYCWFWSLEFNRGKGEVSVLFPWAQDFDNKQSKLDRSISVYRKGDVDQTEIDGLLREISKNLGGRENQKSTILGYKE
jgi:hypothetical protein